MHHAIERKIFTETQMQEPCTKNIRSFRYYDNDHLRYTITRFMLKITN